MLPRIGLAFFAFDVIPQALCVLGIGEDQQVFVMLFTDIICQSAARLSVRDFTVRSRNLENHNAGKLRNHQARSMPVILLPVNRLAAAGVRPTEFFNEERTEVEFLKKVTSSLNIQ